VYNICWEVLILKVKIIEIVESKGKTLYWLARESRISPSAISKLAKGETDSIKFDVLQKICDTLECRIEDVLELEKVEMK
jgi:putative transcriptional regulator